MYVTFRLSQAEVLRDARSHRGSGTESLRVVSVDMSVCDSSLDTTSRDTVDLDHGPPSGADCVEEVVE